MIHPLALAASLFASDGCSVPIWTNGSRCHLSCRPPCGTTTTTPYLHGECWRELEGRFSTMLRASLPIRASNGHGLAAHGECRRRTSARCSWRGVLIFCAGGNKFNGSSTIDVGESKSFGWLTGQKVRLDEIKGLTGRNRKKN